MLTSRACPIQHKRDNIHIKQTDKLVVVHVINIGRISSGFRHILGHLEQFSILQNVKAHWLIVLVCNWNYISDEAFDIMDTLIDTQSGIDGIVARSHDTNTDGSD